MKIKSRIPVMTVSGGENNIDIRVIELQPFRQPHTVHANHFHIQKCHIHMVFFGKIQCIFRISEAVDLSLG